LISNSRVRTKTDRWTLGAVASLLMLAALDQTIVTTALPAIVSDLGRLDQLSWIVTAYLLTSTVSAPLYGKLGDMIGRKIMMQTAVLIFLLSSLAAAMANTMTWMLLARAVQGLGGGGLFVLAFTLVGDMVPMRDRGKIQGLFAAVFGFSSIVDTRSLCGCFWFFIHSRATGRRLFCRYIKLALDFPNKYSDWSICSHSTSQTIRSTTEKNHYV